MENLDVYQNIVSWKKPYHFGRAKLAKWWVRLNPQAEIIAITGSVGKTTTKEAITQVLSQNFSSVASYANLDPVFNIPITILKIRPWTKKVVLEMGIEYSGEMDFYLSLVKPKIGVITQIYLTHTEFLGDLGGVLDEKGKMIEALPKDGVAILNWEDQNVRSLAQKTNARVFWYGLNSQKSDLWAADFRQSFSGSAFLLATKDRRTVVTWKLVGRHNLVSALAAAAVGLNSGLTLDEISQNLAKLTAQPGRLNVKAGLKGSIILDDSYNSSPLAAKASLQTLVELAASRRKIAVLADMLELGKFACQAHQQIGQFASDLGVNLLFAYGDNSKLTIKSAQRSGMVKTAIWFESLTKLIQKLKKEIQNDDLILVKGSRAMRMERVVEAIGE